MAEIYRAPLLGDHDRNVAAEINGMKRELSSRLRTPRRWHGGLRRSAQARAVQGSNTIEGYTITPEDALAAMDDEEPLSADQKTWAEITGYRRVLTYVINLATAPGFTIDAQTLRTMHFMLLEHDFSKSPGCYRTSEIYVRDDRGDRTVYQGPDPELVPDLMESLVASLASPAPVDPMVRAAMAHLNLVMIHPFRDGNGRMARALQTMVMARDKVITPEFSSIEEWLGSNTDDYYRILAATGQGAWHPENDATLWIQFNLRAHHMQAQTLRRRFSEAEVLWGELDQLVATFGLPDRAADVLFDAYQGRRVTRASHMERSGGLDPRTATKDLQRMADVGLLAARGETRARHYVSGPTLGELTDQIRGGRQPLSDAYPDLEARLRLPGARGGAPMDALF